MRARPRWCSAGPGRWHSGFRTRLVAFPNPASGAVEVAIQRPSGSGAARLVVVDALGRRVIERAADAPDQAGES
ncbi:hypothetical protein [Rubricoccus marinus]|uniref:Uncharacterized protein n=1 Tax=Rubricoccus marinus TaxID=716817 RepID=A0A259TVZ7_9BACT|nr:hypothetical protein [Rubricoccus marinus]OZC01754.1 hypothetical protein BSZ36_01380 [Rubricoccus marinus]